MIQENAFLHSPLETETLLRLNSHTEAYVQHRLELFSPSTEGQKLRSELKIPYLELEKPNGDWARMLAEARALHEQFVAHRSDDSQGWRSLCLHGIAAQKTLSSDRYGYKTESEAPYGWTEIADLCPETRRWLEELLAQGYFTELYRVRFMWLEPGGYIKFHRDRQPEQHSLGPMNVALNMPEGCDWLFQKWGSVPFKQGSVIAVDVAFKHAVWNRSHEDRIHLIIHGKYGPRYYQALNEASNQRRKIPQSVQPKPLKPVSVDDVHYGLWNYLPLIETSELTRLCTGLTRHFFKLKSRRPTFLHEDHHLERLMARSLKTGGRWLVVMTPGTIVGSDFFSSVEDLLRAENQNEYDRTFIYGHLLDRGERGYGLHEQFFMIDLLKWDQLRRPSLGWPSTLHFELLKGQRSEGNVHDNYTPLYIKPQFNYQSVNGTLLGWNLIESGLRFGYEMQNLPERLRGNKYFLYPDQNSENLCNRLMNLSAWKAADETELSDYQVKCLLDLQMEVRGFGQKIFAFNTEGRFELRPNTKDQKLDQLFSLASGFKDLAILSHHGAYEHTTVTYYDISAATLFIKRKLFELWDGLDFPVFLRRLMDQYPAVFANSIFAFNFAEINQAWTREVDSWGGPETFMRAFQLAKPLRKEFIEIDLLENPSFIAKNIKASNRRNFAVWHSNCFNFSPSFVKNDFSQQRLDDTASSYLNSMLAASDYGKRKVYLYGEDLTTGTQSPSCGSSVEHHFI